MKTQRTLLITALLIIVVAAASLGIWVWINLPAGTNTSTTGEIREYNGIQLGSINDFRNEAIQGTQYINTSTYRLLITGLVDNETSYTYDQVVNNHAHYQKVVTLHCVEGWEVTALWEGIRLKDLLEEAGYNQTAQVLIFYAQDGYTTSLPLSYIIDNNIMIGYRINGLTLPAKEGFPFQLVAEGKLGYKWIKWITKIEVSNNVNFRGYWEGYGYDNNADYP
jgi:DMSO/TMAO reductase YedYZ molybdopterin-dependent catalytic subunit